jgi:excisionase family DNA binding protein
MKYLTLDEVAAIAKVPRNTVRWWIQIGRLRSTKPGRSRMVAESWLHDLMERNATGGEQ